MMTLKALEEGWVRMVRAAWRPETPAPITATVFFFDEADCMSTDPSILGQSLTDDDPCRSCQPISELKWLSCGIRDRKGPRSLLFIKYEED